MEILPEFVNLLTNPHSLTPKMQKDILAVLHGNAEIVPKSASADKEAKTDRNADCRLVNILKAARLLNMGRNSIYKFIKEGRLDVVELQVGRGKLVTMHSILAFSRNERPPTHVDITNVSQA